MNRSILVSIGICFLFAWSQVAVAQDDEAQPSPPKTVTRVYDIGDLLVWPAVYNYRSSLSPVTRLSQSSEAAGLYGGVGGGGFGGVTAPTEQPTKGTGSGLFSGGSKEEDVAVPMRGELIQWIMDVIQNTVDPDNWRESGGTIGSASEFQGRLIVTQTEENHDRISALFTELRKDQHRQVSVSVRWVRLSAEQSDGLLQKGKGGVLDAEKLSGLVKAHPQAVVYEGMTRCFDAQTVNIATGRGQTVVVGSEAMLAAGTKAIQPKVEPLLIGALLEITPTLYPGGNEVVVDLHSVVSEDFTTTHAKAHEDDILDRMKFAVQHFDTTARIPIGVPVLVGGMTTLRDDVRDPLYLILQVTRE